MKPIEGTIKRDLQEKLGQITSLMAEISPPIYVVYGMVSSKKRVVFRNIS